LAYGERSVADEGAEVGEGAVSRLGSAATVKAHSIRLDNRRLNFDNGIERN